jgi:hypothetical protein
MSLSSTSLVDYQVIDILGGVLGGEINKLKVNNQSNLYLNSNK